MIPQDNHLRSIHTPFLRFLPHYSTRGQWHLTTTFLADYMTLFYLKFQVLYVWPGRWSIIKIVYLFNRYFSIICLAVAVGQQAGWYRDSSSKVIDYFTYCVISY